MAVLASTSSNITHWPKCIFRIPGSLNVQIRQNLETTINILFLTTLSWNRNRLVLCRQLLTTEYRKRIKYVLPAKPVSVYQYFVFGSLMRIPLYSWRYGILFREISSINYWTLNRSLKKFSIKSPFYNLGPIRKAFISGVGIFGFAGTDLGSIDCWIRNMNKIRPTVQAQTDIHTLSGVRNHDSVFDRAKTFHALDCAATVIGRALHSRMQHKDRRPRTKYPSANLYAV
jgi:hypothetical protein